MKSCTRLDNKRKNHYYGWVARWHIHKKFKLVTPVYQVIKLSQAKVNKKKIVLKKRAVQKLAI